MASDRSIKSSSVAGGTLLGGTASGFELRTRERLDGHFWPGVDVVGVGAAEGVDEGILVSGISIVNGFPHTAGDLVDFVWIRCVGADRLSCWSFTFVDGYS